MKPQTYNILKRILVIDGEIDKPRIDYVLEVLSGRLDVPDKPVRQGVLRRSEVARLLGISLRSVDSYVVQGHLQRVYRNGGKQALGISRQSYERFIENGCRQ